MVNHARVIDTDGYLYTFNTLDSTSWDPGSVDRWPENAHGFGGQFNNVKKPPQYIVFCWDSYIDQQTYETSAVFGPDTWLRMKTPADHIWSNGDLSGTTEWCLASLPAAKSKSGFLMSPDAPACLLNH
jgi:hypothetical protein